MTPPKTRIFPKEVHYEKIDYTENGFPKGEYENCTFVGCDFTNVDISFCIFIECEFTRCNFSMAKLTKAGFRDIKFKDSKLLGVQFQVCDPFLMAMSFENCNLNLTSFFKLRLWRLKTSNCSLHEVDFSEADLTLSVFHHSDMMGCIFDNTTLHSVDFITATNYSIDPDNNRVNKAKFSHFGVIGLLDKYDIIIE